MITDDKFIIFVLPLILLIGAAIVGQAFALPAYPDGYYDENGYPVTKDCNCELTDDDDKEEDEELEDEQLHEEWAKANENN